MTVRLWNQQYTAISMHSSVTLESWKKIKEGICTSDGNADGLTVIDTNSDSSGADAYNGAYWIKILSGVCKGEMKRITDDDGAGTYTIEGNGFSAKIVTGVEFEIYKSPEPIVVVDSSSAETNVVDATRAEANVSGSGAWIGFYMCPITGTYKGKIGKITAFDPSTGTFTLAPGLGGSLTAGDVAELRSFIEVKDFKLPTEWAYHERPSTRENFSIGDGIPGAKGGQVTFTTNIFGSNALAASGSYAGTSVLRPLFQAAGLVETVGKSATIDSGSDTNSIKIASGSRENFDVGQMVVYDGNAAFITSLADGGAMEAYPYMAPPS